MENIQSLIDVVNKKVLSYEISQENRKNLLKQIEKYEKELEDIKTERKNHEEASGAILKFLEACRNKSKSVFEELGTSALASVFGEGYELEIVYNESHKSPVADIDISIPTKYNEKITVSLDQCGGGMIDLVSMVFCISQLELLHPRLEGPILSDEYFKYLSDDMRAPAAEVLCETLKPDGIGAEGEGRQLIMITHAKEFFDYADRIFYFRKAGEASSVEDVSSRYMDVVGSSEVLPENSGDTE